MENNKNENRRDFLKSAGTLMGLGLCGCLVSSILTACDKDEEITAPAKPTGDYPMIKIADFPELANVGGLVKTKNFLDKDGKPKILARAVFIFRIATDKFISLDSLCLHKSADVELKSGELVCSLHSAKFDKNDGKTLDNGFAGETVPPLSIFGNIFDPINGTLKVKV